MNNQELIKYLESKIDETKGLIEVATELDYMNSLYGRIDGIDIAIKKIKELNDQVPTIKPGDKVRITDAMNRSCIGKEDIVTQISGSAPYSARLENFLGDWPLSSLEVVE